MIKIYSPNKLTEEIGKHHIDKIMKEFSAWSKNIRNIQSFEDIITVYHAFEKWDEHFVQFIFRNFMGIDKRGGMTKAILKHRPIMEEVINAYEELFHFFYDGLGDKVKSLTLDTVTLEAKDVSFPYDTKGILYSNTGKSVYTDNIEKFRNQAHELAYRYASRMLAYHPYVVNKLLEDGKTTLYPPGLTKKDLPEEEVKKLYYLLWTTHRDSRYQKITRIGRSISESLDFAFAHIAHAVYTDDDRRIPVATEHEVIDVIKKYGAIIHMKYEENDKEVVKKYLTATEHAFDAVKNTGFSRALDNIDVTINLSDSPQEFTLRSGARSQYAGVYFLKDGTIQVFPETKTMSYAIVTLIHEIGHRYYYQVMSKDQRKQWDEFAIPNLFRATTSYGSENEREFFAETFTAFVLAKSGFVSRIKIDKRYYADAEIIDIFMRVLNLPR